ncbi:MAG: peptidoglycan DD-metalloendopeptidase family protein [Ruminococcus sp.]|nr:peptidoglycan DD-metalloendopeptidase family protein [Ruminococcus sp.]
MIRETKFIGIDGFGKIETVKTTRKIKKTSNFKRFLKTACTIAKGCKNSLKTKAENRKASKPTLLEQHYANLRKQGAEKLSTATIAKGKAHYAKSKALRHIGKGKKASVKLLKSKAALGIATSFMAVMLCTLTATSTLSFSAFAAKSDAKTSSADEVKDMPVKGTELSKKIYSEIASDEEVPTDGFGLYIDGELVGVSLDEEALENALENNLNEYKAKYDDETTDEFANDVKIVFGSYKSNLVDNSENIVNKNKDKFSYSLSTDIESIETIDYETEVEYDDDEYTDYYKVIQKGIEGKVKYVYRVTFIDGVQSDSKLAKKEVIKKVQNKIVVEGTKEQGVSTGSFIWPLPYTGNVTSGYGGRWGRMHSGIDIAAGGVNGQSIVASDGGTVEWAGYDSSGYGNYVIINHNNGYKTLYGHCSALFVTTGQSVSQGQSIAAVGSTGDSTGPHLHFEIRTSSGDRLNPLEFV